jgi:hypothetical protein
VEADPTKRNALLLEAFRYYAAAAERAYDVDWPDEAWRQWRYRRATLVRLLAREGVMQQVADAYTKVLDKWTPHPPTMWPTIKTILHLQNGNVQPRRMFRSHAREKSSPRVLHHKSRLRASQDESPHFLIGNML